MRKFVIALLISAIAVSLSVPLTFGTSLFSIGSANVGDTWAGGYYPAGNKLNLTVPSGFKVHWTLVSAYTKNDSAGQTIQLAIFDASGVLIEKSAEIDVAGEGWYNATFDSYSVCDSVYLVLGTSEINMKSILNDGVSNAYYGGAYPMGGSFPPTIWGTYAISIYARYELVPLSETVSVDSTSIGALVVAIFLVLLNVLLIIKPVPLLGFSVAMITFGSVLLILGYSMPYAGLFAMMLSIVSVISIARSAKIYRGD